MAVFFAVMMLFAFTACKNSTDEPATDSEKATIVGSWEYTGGTYVYTFNEDGTGTYDTGSAVMNFTYEATDTELSISYEGNTSPTVLEYVLDGDTLNVKDSFGSDTVYKRK